MIYLIILTKEQMSLGNLPQQAEHFYNLIISVYCSMFLYSLFPVSFLVFLSFNDT